MPEPLKGSSIQRAGHDDRLRARLLDDEDVDLLTAEEAKGDDDDDDDDDDD